MMYSRERSHGDRKGVSVFHICSGKKRMKGKGGGGIYETRLHWDICKKIRSSENHRRAVAWVGYVMGVCGYMKYNKAAAIQLDITTVKNRILYLFRLLVTSARIFLPLTILLCNSNCAHNPCMLVGLIRISLLPSAKYSTRETRLESGSFLILRIFLLLVCGFRCIPRCLVVFVYLP